MEDGTDSMAAEVVDAPGTEASGDVAYFWSQGMSEDEAREAAGQATFGDAFRATAEGAAFPVPEGIRALADEDAVAPQEVEAGEKAEAAAEEKVEKPSEVKAEAEAPAVPSYDVVAEARKAAPGLALDKPEDVPVRLAELHADLQAYEPVERAFAASPKLAPLIKALAGGEGELAALRSAFPDLVREVEETDPEYVALREKDAEARVRREYEAKEAEKQRAVNARIARQQEETWAEFQRRKGDGFDRAGFEAQVRSLLYPQETGRLRGDFFDVLDRGLNHETLTAAAVEKAREQAKAETLGEIRAGRLKLDQAPTKSGPAAPPPTLGGSGGPTGGAQPRNADEANRLAFARGIGGTDFWGNPTTRA